MSERRSGRPNPIADPTSNEMLESYIFLGRQLAAQMAEESFRVLTATPGWTLARLEEATEIAVERMGIASRDALSGNGADPGNEVWQMIWSAMEASYRETMETLLKASGRRGGGTLQ